ncbi:hypothetical protein ATANTOWER_025579 [Ataeniobius toweri]|uniref:Uncharacterized protein n=1 Tax=Ataeniobius toweri TaxID=208326 RepID=A0ABU7BKL8_9TELE|nr:hypothetical protein [Ataeniobius toweri]
MAGSGEKRGTERTKSSTPQCYAHIPARLPDARKRATRLVNLKAQMEGGGLLPPCVKRKLHSRSGHGGTVTGEKETRQTKGRKNSKTPGVCFFLFAPHVLWCNSSPSRRHSGQAGTQNQFQTAPNGYLTPFSLRFSLFFAIA